jgi:hypothetical protein
MAFQKKELRLLAAPLNLQTPGDKIGQRFSLLMQNLRIDGKGRLLCRRGVEQFGAGVGEPIHTLMKSGHAVGLYLAAGSDLYADNGATDLGASFDGYPVGWANAGDFIWFMNRSGPKKRAAGGSLQDWSILTPTAPLGAAVGGGAGALTGTYQLYVTFVNATEGESNPSEGIEVTLSAEAITITGIPTSPDSQVVKRRIYIGGGTLGAIYLLVEINDNTTTEVTVNRTETELTDLGLIMPTNHDPAPAARGLAGPYFQRLIAYSSEEFPHAYWWTETNEFDYFPATNTNYIGSADTPILFITHHKRQLNFYKPEGIWRLQNDPATTGDQEQTNAGFGALGPQAVTAAGAVDYFVGPRGVFLMDGDRAIEISEPIRGIFEDDRYIPVTAEFAVRPMSSDPDARARTVCGFDGHRLRVSYCEQGFTAPNATLVYDPLSGEWSGERIATDLGMGDGLYSFLYDPAGDHIYAGGTDGFIYTLDHSADDHGNGIPVYYFSHYEDFGLPDNAKILDDIQIEGDARGQNLTIKLWADDGAVEIPIGTFNLTGYTRQTFAIRDAGTVPGFEGFTGQVGQRIRNVAVDLNGDISSQEGLIIEALILHYRVEVREGRTFDTGPIDLGTNLVKGIFEFELEIESNTAVTWTLLTDLPQNALTQRDTGSLPTTGGVRGSRFIKLATPYDGHRMQFTLEAIDVFRLYSVWVRFLPYGEYISGPAGQTYESKVFPLAA